MKKNLTEKRQGNRLKSEGRARRGEAFAHLLSRLKSGRREAMALRGEKGAVG